MIVSSSPSNKKQRNRRPSATSSLRASVEARRSATALGGGDLGRQAARDLVDVQVAAADVGCGKNQEEIAEAETSEQGPACTSHRGKRRKVVSSAGIDQYTEEATKDGLSDDPVLSGFFVCLLALSGLLLLHILHLLRHQQEHGHEI